MILVGLILILLVVVVVLVLILTGTGPQATATLRWDAVNLQWHPNALAIFTLGALTLLVLVIGLLLIRAGVRRRRAKGRELKRLRQLEHQDTAHPDDTRKVPTTRAREAPGASPAAGHRADPADDTWDAEGHRP